MIFPGNSGSAVAKQASNFGFLQNEEGVLWERLEKVRTGKENFITSDVATLANTVRMQYMMVLHKNEDEMPADVHTSRNLVRLWECAKTYMKGAAPYTRQQERGFRLMLRELQDAYYAAKYDVVNKDEFDRLFDFSKKGRENIMKSIEKECLAERNF